MNKEWPFMNIKGSEQTFIIKNTENSRKILSITGSHSWYMNKLAVSREGVIVLFLNTVALIKG